MKQIFRPKTLETVLWVAGWKLSRSVKICANRSEEFGFGTQPLDFFQRESPEQRLRSSAKDKKHYDAEKTGNEYYLYKILKPTPIIFACRYKVFNMHDSCPKCNKWIEERGLIRNWKFKGVQKKKRPGNRRFYSDKSASKRAGRLGQMKFHPLQANRL